MGISDVMIYESYDVLTRYSNVDMLIVFDLFTMFL